MTTADIIDIAALVVLIVFTVYGAWRGLIKTVAALALTIVTLVGAALIANTFATPLAEQVAPRMEDWVTAQVTQALSTSDVPDLAAKASRGSVGDLSLNAVPFETLSGIMERLEQNGGLPQHIAEGLKNGMESLWGTFSGTVSQAVTNAVTGLLRPVCYGLLYFLSYTALSILGGFIMKILDPFLKLPLLRTVDTVGGLVLGLLEGSLVVLVAAFVLSLLAQYFEIDALSGSRLLEDVLPRLTGILPFLNRPVS